MSGSPSISIDALLAHSSWLRRLASHLVSDPDQADDLVHETWALALEKPPAPGIDPRRWLARVMRNRAKNRYREASLKQFHETSASRTEVWSPADIEQRVGLQKQVAEAVFGLEEPYRTAITLHYFEELSAEEIARGQGTTAVNVRKQLSRGREMLRARLDREFGGREAWCLLFVQVLRKGSAAPVAAGTGKAVALTTIAAALAILSLFVWRQLRSDHSSPARSDAVAGVIADDDRNPERIPSETDPVSRRREQLGSRSRKADPEREIRGVVLGADDRPIAGATIVVSDDDVSGYAWGPDEGVQRREVASTETDGQGVFAVEVKPGRPYELEASAEGYATTTLGYRCAGSNLSVRLGAGENLEGRVIRASDGSAVARARLEITTDQGTLEEARLLLRHGETDEAGRFRFDNLPGIPVSLRLTPRFDGAPASRAVRIEPGRTKPIEIVVEEGATIRGRILDAMTGEPIPHAEIGETGRYDRFLPAREDGTYTYVGVRGPGSGVALTARARGYATSIHAFRVANNVDDLPEVYDFLLTPVIAVEGGVVDSDGHPVVDAYVVAVPNPPIHPKTDQGARIRGRTDDRGRFKLPDARRDLAYTLLARHEGSGTAVMPCVTISPGAGAAVQDVGTLFLPVASTLSGVVLDVRGSPVPDWTVTLVETNVERKQDPACPQPMNPAFLRELTGRNAKTDDQGRFVFADVGGGEYTVSAKNLESDLASTSVDVRVLPGQPLEGVQLVIRTLDGIEGRLTDPEGRGVGGIFVRALTPDGRTAIATTSDAAGSFRLKGLLAGTYRVEARPDLSSVRSLEFLGEDRDHVRPGEKSVVLVLEHATLLRGRLVDADDRGVPRGTVWARTHDREFWAMTDLDGAFAIAIPFGVAVDLEAFPETPQGVIADRIVRRSAVLPTEPNLILRLPR